MQGLMSASGRLHPAVRMNRLIGTLVCLSFLCARTEGRGQSLIGTTGLISVPSAAMAGDGEIMLGTAVGNRKYNVRDTRFHEYSFFVTMGYLPFLEVSLRLHHHYRFIRPEDGRTTQGIGDRMASVRLRLHRETKTLPAVVLGAHDFYSAFGQSSEVVFNNSLYAAASKTLRFPGSPFRLGLHAGYGTDWMKAERHDLVGWFGGISMDAGSFVTLLTEYDTEKLNVGAAFHFFRHVQVLLALKNFDTFAGSMAYAFRLQ
jgi:hypothetical protein